MTRGSKIHTVCIEGPDLSGKTSLYRDLHKMSNFRWNIQDRAEVSMLAFSKFYERGDHQRWQDALSDRLKDMNHRYVLILPSVNLLTDRYYERGDEIHTLQSLAETYSIFESTFQNLANHPNVLFVKVTHENQSTLAKTVFDWLDKSEKEDLCGLAKRIENTASHFGGEALGVTFQYDFDDEYTDADPAVLTYELEAEYYQGIRSQFIRKITKEISGENEYRSAQNPLTTRRFVYAHDSCISLVNLLIRGNTLNVYATLRSSNTNHTLSYDLRFIANLISEAETFIDADIKRRVLNVEIHSAHIIN